MEATIFEVIMLICFGFSWPISVFKSLRSKSTKGKSIIFISAIIVGYVCGIVSKILSNNFSYSFILYIINLLFVSLDFVIFFVNRSRELKVSSSHTSLLSA